MLDRTLLALKLLHQFQAVERVVYVPGTERMENDVEHSYLLAMIAWQLAEVLAPELSRDKVIRYALVHDLVEVYAGDVFFYDTSSAYAQDKQAREHAALVRLTSEGIIGSDICDALIAYELRADDEAKFVYALDKVMPMMTIYLDGGRLWKTHGITREKLYTLKRSKIECSPPILSFFEELSAHLKTHEQELFAPLS